MKEKITLKNISINDSDEKNYPQISIADVQKEFEANLKERGLRIATFRFYKNILEVFYKFMNSNNPICNITPNTLNDYIHYCEKKHHSQNTISTDMRGLRTFLYFAMKNNYMPKFKIHVPAPDLTPKTTYSVEEIQKLLVRPNLQHCNFSKYVAYVAINIFVFTGCRLSTAINMKIEDIDFENNLIIYRHTKNKHPHCVPLAQQLKTVLKKYINILKQQNIKTDYLLISAYGEPLTDKKLYKYVRDYNIKRNVKTTSIHAFRRFYIKSLVIQGVPIPKIQFLVQHKKPELITLYTKLYSSDLVEDVAQFSNNILPPKPTKLSLKNHKQVKGGNR